MLFLSPACGFQLGTQGKSEPSLGQAWMFLHWEEKPDPEFPGGKDSKNKSECRPGASLGEWGHRVGARQGPWQGLLVTAVREWAGDDQVRPSSDPANPGKSLESRAGRTL